jgi:hypothetical protein
LLMFRATFQPIKWHFLDEEDEAEGVEQLRQMAGEGSNAPTIRDGEEAQGFDVALTLVSSLTQI